MLGEISDPGQPLEPLANSNCRDWIALDKDLFISAGRAGGDFQAGLGCAERLGKHFHAGFVGGSFGRGSGDFYFNGIALRADNLVSRGFGLDPNLE